MDVCLCGVYVCRFLSSDFSPSKFLQPFLRKEKDKKASRLWRVFCLFVFLIVFSGLIFFFLCCLCVHACRLNILLLFVPLSFWSVLYGWPSLLIFISNFLALIPLASLLGTATEELALHTGGTAENKEEKEEKKKKKKKRRKNTTTARARTAHHLDRLSLHSRDTSIHKGRSKIERFKRGRLCKIYLRFKTDRDTHKHAYIDRHRSSNRGVGRLIYEICFASWMDCTSLVADVETRCEEKNTRDETCKISKSQK